MASSPDGPGVPVAVTFAPRIESKIRQAYGAAETEVVRDAVITAVSESFRKAGAGPDLSVAVEVTDVAPSHPTRQQSLDSPSLDPVRSKSLGGAALTGTVSGPDGKVIANLSFQRFAPDLRSASVSFDAWADARLSIQIFASQLAKKAKNAR
jgi:hypothetical protein